MDDKLPRLYTSNDVLEAVGRSERWLRQEIAKGGVPHTRLGRSIKFTAQQYDAFIASFAQNEKPRSITTGRKRKTA